jgi:hypothetical protein
MPPLRLRAFCHLVDKGMQLTCVPSIAPITLLKKKENLGLLVISGAIDLAIGCSNYRTAVKKERHKFCENIFNNVSTIQNEKKIQGDCLIRVLKALTDMSNRQAGDRHIEKNSYLLLQ